MNPATAEGVAPVLRCRTLEMIDDHGRLRAQLLVTPAVTMNGKRYDESSLFRLIDVNGRPAVKIGAGVSGTGMSMAGDSERRDWSGVQILAEGKGAVVKLTNRNGKVQVIGE